jgi:multiple sugar transport system permease protein
VRVFRSIALPLATPVVALVGLFSVVTNWNNYFLPFVMQSGSRRMPIQVGLTELLTSPISNPQLAIATLLAIAPVLVIFVFSQRFLVSGSTTGGTEE